VYVVDIISLGKNINPTKTCIKLLLKAHKFFGQFSSFIHAFENSQTRPIIARHYIKKI
jgi:hypothetical protein